MKKLLLVLFLLPLYCVPAHSTETTKPKLNQSIFRMFMMAGDRKAGAGSVTYTDKGLLTCYHCVEPLGQAFYKRVPGQPVLVKGYITGYVVDAFGRTRKIVAWKRLHEDIVELFVEGELPAEWVPLTWGAIPTPGDMVKAVGFYGASGFSDPQAGLLSVSVGYYQELTYDGYLRHSAPVGPGMSGSALLNMAGEVIGITAWVGNTAGAAVLQ